MGTVESVHTMTCFSSQLSFRKCCYGNYIVMGDRRGITVFSVLDEEREKKFEFS